MKKIILTAILIISIVFLYGCDIFSPGEDKNSNPDTSLNPEQNITDGTSDQSHGEHIDENNSGKCDICSISVITVFDFYAINDLHGKFSDTDSQPGVDELTTYLKNARSSNKNTVFLASGDIWQGTAESNLTGGLLLTDWMNEMDFASMTLGNHEFDWGEDFIENNDKYAEFPFLAINIFDSDTNERVTYCDASTVLDYDDVQIGIIGAIGDVYSSISSDKVEDVYFKTGDQLTELIKAESKKLRESGVDIIIYSLHDGYEKNKSSVTNVSSNEIASYYDIELSKGGYVDLVFEAHTHKYYTLRDTYGIYHLQGGGENKSISHVKMNYNYANSKCSVETASTIQNIVYSQKESDPIVNNLLSKYGDVLAKGDEVLGINPSKISSDDLSDLVAKVYYEKGEETWGDEYDIVLGGGFISPRSPYNLYAGEVKYSDLYSLFPFDNAIVLCSIKGSDLKNRFFADRDDYHIYCGDYGNSIKNSIDNNKTYYIITDTYSSLYAPNKLTVIKTYDNLTFARDLLAEYIKDGKLSN